MELKLVYFMVLGEKTGFLGFSTEVGVKDGCLMLYMREEVDSASGGDLKLGTDSL